MTEVFKESCTRQELNSCKTMNQFRLNCEIFGFFDKGRLLHTRKVLRGEWYPLDHRCSTSSPLAKSSPHSHGISLTGIPMGEKFWHRGSGGSSIWPAPALPRTLLHSRIRAGPAPCMSGSGQAAPHPSMWIWIGASPPCPFSSMHQDQCRAAPQPAASLDQSPGCSLPRWPTWVNRSRSGCTPPQLV